MEEIEKDTRYRQEYAEGIADFLNREKEKAETHRWAFFNPENYKADQEEYRKQFVEMLGFPLNKEKSVPTLIKKTLVGQDGNVNIYRLQFLFWDCIKVYALYFEQLNADMDTPYDWIAWWRGYARVGKQHPHGFSQLSSFGASHDG